MKEIKLLPGSIPGFIGTGVATVDAGDGLITNHPPGGVAIFYRNKLSSYVSVIDTKLDWVTGIKFCKNNISIYIFSVYLPCCNKKNEDSYLSKMGQLISIVNDLNSPNIFLVGDFNADINAKTLFGKHLRDFCDDNNMICSTVDKLPRDSYSYVSYAWHTCSWLDHCISTHSADNLTSNFEIHYSVSSRDHIPFSFDLDIGAVNYNIISETKVSSQYISWHDISTEKITDYSNKVQMRMEWYQKKLNQICCNNRCQNPKHHREIITLYDSLTSFLKNVGCNTLVDKPITDHRDNRTVLPGWNSHVKHLQEISVTACRVWRQNGCPKTGVVYDKMKSSHKDYKNSIRFIKRNEDVIRKEKLAEKLIQNNSKSFWDDVKKYNHTRVRSTNIEGLDNEGEICEFWGRHYAELLNCVGHEVPVHVGESNDDNFTAVTVQEIIDGLNVVKTGKGPGPDGLTIEHYINGGSKLTSVIATLFTLFITHNILPESFMDVYLTPVVKDLKKNITLKTNYRPIANATAISKLLEAVIKLRIEKYLNVTSNQFGFTPNSGTDMCTYLMKEIIDKFNNIYHRGYICLLDASKAFDRVNHTKLFNKLIARGVPGYIVRLLMNWYSNQKLYAKWGDKKSESFKSTNGIKQGGLLSPVLFNLYLDELSTALNDVHVGCMIGGARVNHILYADDLALVSPSLSGLEKLNKICELEAQSHNIIFNAAKSNLLIMRGNGANQLVNHSLKMNGETVPEVEHVKYLGTILNSDGSDDMDMMRACRYIYAFGNSLIKGFGKCSKFVKILLFKTYMYQMYCASNWSKYRAATFQKIKVAYNSVFRRLMNVPRFQNGINYSARNTFVSNRTHSLPERLRMHIYSLMARLRTSGNQIIQNAVLYSGLPLKSQIWRVWREKLYTKFQVM